MTKHKNVQGAIPPQLHPALLCKHHAISLALHIYCDSFFMISHISSFMVLEASQQKQKQAGCGCVCIETLKTAYCKVLRLKFKSCTFFSVLSLFSSCHGQTRLHHFTMQTKIINIAEVTSHKECCKFPTTCLLETFLPLKV